LGAGISISAAKKPAGAGQACLVPQSPRVHTPASSMRRRTPHLAMIQCVGNEKRRGVRVLQISTPHKSPALIASPRQSRILNAEGFRSTLATSRSLSHFYEYATYQDLRIICRFELVPRIVSSAGFGPPGPIAVRVACMAGSPA